MYACLFTCLKTTSSNFIKYILPVVMALSSSDNNAIFYVFMFCGLDNITLSHNGAYMHGVRLKAAILNCPVLLTSLQENHNTLQN